MCGQTRMIGLLFVQPMPLFLECGEALLEVHLTKDMMQLASLEKKIFNI